MRDDAPAAAHGPGEVENVQGRRDMKIAITGIRGIPACYGGFETFAEELAPRLAGRGHEVTVYGRSNIITHPGPYYKGVRLTVLPTISHKYFDTVVHSFLSLVHAAFRDFDVVLLCNAANSPFCFIPRLAGKKLVLNVDGIERKRDKWNALGRLWYRMGELCATVFPHVAVSDALVIQRYYRETYGRDTVFIPYGADIAVTRTTEALDRFGLQPGAYVLYVSRLEPENNAHLVIEAFEKISTDKRLVIVGDAPYASEYIARLKSTRDPRILFTGYVFGRGYRELQSHAYCYVQATSVGGTHPALIEAMGSGGCVIANGTPENREVLADAGLIFEANDAGDLKRRLELVLGGGVPVEELRRKSRQRIAEKYSWNAVVDAYETLFAGLL